jgi:hypothetical protein
MDSTLVFRFTAIECVATGSETVIKNKNVYSNVFFPEDVVRETMNLFFKTALV